MQSWPYEINVKSIWKEKMTETDRQTDLVLRLRAARAGSRGSREESPVPDSMVPFPKDKGWFPATTLESD